MQSLASRQGHVANLEPFSDGALFERRDATVNFTLVAPKLLKPLKTPFRPLSSPRATYDHYFLAIAAAVGGTGLPVGEERSATVSYRTAEVPFNAMPRGCQQ